MIQYFKTLVYLLVRLSFSIAFNHEIVPVYSAFHTQVDLHLSFNPTLRNNIGMNLRSITNEKQATEQIYQ